MSTSYPGYLCQATIEIEFSDGYYINIITFAKKKRKNTRKEFNLSFSFFLFFTHPKLGVIMFITRRTASARSRKRTFFSLCLLMQVSPTERRITERHDRSVANRTANLILNSLSHPSFYSDPSLRAPVDTSPSFRQTSGWVNTNF